MPTIPIMPHPEKLETSPEQCDVHLLAKEIKPDPERITPTTKKRTASPDCDLQTSTQLCAPIPQLDGFIGDEEILITVQIPERKGEKMIFYLKLLKENRIVDLNKEVESMPVTPKQQTG
jgi:hypothetical protein